MQLRSVVSSTYSALFMILVVLSGCQSNTSSTSSPTAPAVLIQTPTSVLQEKYIATPFPTLAPSDAEDVLSYPGAKNVDTKTVYASEWSSARYEVDASVEEVVAYYKEQLPKQDWRLDHENVFSQTPMIVLFYEWSDKNGTLSWDLDLLIETRSLDGKVYVNQSLYRRPNFDRIPMYPGAQQVEKKEEPSSHWEGYLERNISYVTSARPEEVDAYYKSVLPQHGWAGPAGDGDIEKNGILFGWSWGGLHGGKSIGLNIVAKQEPDGQTKVEMKLDGTLVR